MVKQVGTDCWESGAVAIKRLRKSGKLQARLALNASERPCRAVQQAASSIIANLSEQLAQALELALNSLDRAGGARSGCGHPHQLRPMPMNGPSIAGLPTGRSMLGTRVGAMVQRGPCEALSDFRPEEFQATKEAVQGCENEVALVAWYASLAPVGYPTRSDESRRPGDGLRVVESCGWPLTGPSSMSPSYSIGLRG